jgi:hypothetical protein
LLGLVDDRPTHAFFPTPEHRCFVKKVHAPSAARQVQFCISERFGECPDFAKHMAKANRPPRPSRGFLRGLRYSPIRLIIPSLVFASAIVATLVLAAAPALAR